MCDEMVTVECLSDLNGDGTGDSGNRVVLSGDLPSTPGSSGVLRLDADRAPVGAPVRPPGA